MKPRAWADAVDERACYEYHLDRCSFVPNHPVAPSIFLDLPSLRPHLSPDHCRSCGHHLWCHRYELVLEGG